MSPRRPAPSAPSPPASLRVVDAGGSSRRFVLPGEHGVVIGTAPHCEVRLDDAYVSRRHASVGRSGDRFLVDDLGSANGTTLNGRRLHGQEQLRPGDVIGVGRTRLTFACPPGGAPVRPRDPERRTAALVAVGAGLAAAGALTTYRWVGLIAGLIILTVGVRCAALNKVFKHGVGRKGAKDKVSGKTKKVTNFTVYTKMYEANRAKLDRDKDGIACEKR
ncbi:FHA domain-containing protein [Actinoplanes solisilvae]|uniref:FHA domain-containing protein n=1 Tax=Actinoplanes solisilvae TaxID=2486853 RepID=UPI000FDAD23D|nr:FHA domain-containing protein [Actinoplanes solisilvae]